MKFYFAQGTCSLASHIALNELGLNYTPIPMDFEGDDFSDPGFMKLNPSGSVPVLELENGRVLTEGVVIMEYLATLKPYLELVPEYGTYEYFNFRKWMNYLATELHKGFGPLWNMDSISDQEETRKVIWNHATSQLTECFEFLNRHLSTHPFLCGNAYTVADGYLFTIMSWCSFVDLDYTNCLHLGEYVSRIESRPAVIKTLKLEEELCK